MKRSLIILTVLLLACPIFAQNDANIAGAGLRYDESLLMSIGYGTKITGGLWEFNYLDIGHYDALSVQLGYFMGFGDFTLGLLAGPGADWYDTPGDGSAALNYISGASGVAAHYWFADHWGIGAYGQYKFALAEGTLYPDGYTWGVGVSHSW